jgi:pimeloyl-ACP methyl ester carboxylesterase
MSSPGTSANAIAAFYGGNGITRGLAALLRATQRALGAGAASAAALKIFFTPLPTKWAARRRRVPADWQSQEWLFEGVSLTAWQRGAPSAGRPTVLLVHGWAGDAQQMRPLGELLWQQGFQPVLLDLPGHGRSRGWRSNLPQFGRALYAASARLGPLHGVVAHSLGAVAALHASAQGWPVQRLALLAPSPTPNQVLRWFAHSFGLNDATLQRMVQKIEQREGVPLHQFEAPWLGERLQQPTLIVHDEQDRAAPLANSQRLAGALRRAQLKVTQQLGHRRILSDPQVAQAVLAHLQAD